MESIALICISISVLCIIGLAIIIRHRSLPTEEEKKTAKVFLDKFNDTLYNMMLGIIRDFNYEDYDNIMDIQSEILLRIDKMCNEYLNTEIEKSSLLLEPMVVKILKSGLVDEYLDNLITSFNIESVIETHTNGLYQNRLDESVKEDEELQKEYSNETEYFSNEQSSNENLESVTEESLEQLMKDENKDTKELKPERETEEEYNSEDVSMELLDENEESTTDNSESDIYYDSRGRARSRATGKFIKVQGL